MMNKYSVILKIFQDVAAYDGESGTEGSEGGYHKFSEHALQIQAAMKKDPAVDISELSKVSIV